MSRRSPSPGARLWRGMVLSIFSAQRTCHPAEPPGAAPSRCLHQTYRCKYVGNTLQFRHAGPRADRLSVFGDGAHVVEPTAPHLTTLNCHSCSLRFVFARRVGAKHIDVTLAPGAGARQPGLSWPLLPHRGAPLGSYEISCTKKPSSGPGLGRLVPRRGQTYRCQYANSTHSYVVHTLPTRKIGTPSVR